MKEFKKITALLLCLAALLCVFVSCDAEPAPEPTPAPEPAPAPEPTKAEKIQAALDALAPKYATQFERSAANGFQFEATCSEEEWNEVAPDYYRIDLSKFADIPIDGRHKYEDTANSKYVGMVIDFDELLEVADRGMIHVAFYKYGYDSYCDTILDGTYDPFNEYAGIKLLKAEFDEYPIFKAVISVGGMAREIYFKVM